MKDQDHELQLAVEALQNLLVSVATGGARHEDDYRRFRNSLMADPQVKHLLPDFLSTCRDLAQFWPYIQGKGGYVARREFLWDQFRPLLDMLEGIEAKPARPVPPSRDVAPGEETATQERTVILPKETTRPRLFIVHGRNEVVKLSVKNYLQNTLKLPEPIILHEQANLGRTLIEKLEHYGGEAEGAVVLLTPDDHWIDSGSNEELRRARQNVIFELGFFYGKFGRSSGRVILLYQGDLDIPTDIAGVTYIDISAGVEAAGERIRKELGL